MPEEHNHLILTSQHVTKLKYRSLPQKSKPFLYFTESLERDDIDIIGLQKKMNPTAEF